VKGVVAGDHASQTAVAEISHLCFFCFDYDLLPGYCKNRGGEKLVGQKRIVFTSLSEGEASAIHQYQGQITSRRKDPPKHGRDRIGLARLTTMMIRLLYK